MQEMILIIDNYDSFTYNLAQYVGEMSVKLQVYRIDALTIEQIVQLSPKKIIISPGPGTPDDAGITQAIIREFAGKIPKF